MTIKIKSLRWWIIGLVTLGTITNYLARSSLSVAAPTVLQQLDISTQQYGWITGAFLAMYPIGAPSPVSSQSPTECSENWKPTPWVR